MSNTFMVRLFAFTKEHVQGAFDKVCQQVSILMRRGEDDVWEPKALAFADKADIKEPKAKIIAYDSATGKIVRYNGTSWADLT